jgi:GT2 family glycosyltransferase
MAKLGLVTVLYKSENVLSGFFQSLGNQSFKDYHLYLIDNSPSDENNRLIEKFAREYKIVDFTHVRNEENYGVAKGNNQGIELALKSESEYILLLNNDIEFTQTFLFSDLISYAETNNEYLIVPKILYYGTRTIWMAGGRFLKLKGFTTHYGENQLDCYKYNQKKYFDYAPTCFMLVHKTVFEIVGRMDEKYFVYYDDTDFIYRAIKKKLRILYMPEFEIFHKVSSSTGGNETLFSIYYLNRNRIYFIKKNMNPIISCCAISYTLLTRSIKFIKYDRQQRKSLILGLKASFKM